MIKNVIFLAILAGGLLLSATNTFAKTPTPKVSVSEQQAIYSTAGFYKKGRYWVSKHCPKTCSTEISLYKDVNGDGLPEAMVIEHASDSETYGNTGQAYVFLSKQKNSTWKILSRGIAIPELLKTQGKNGYPDIEMGGPGFCFQNLRFDGKSYQDNGMTYEGKACKF